MSFIFHHSTPQQDTHNTPTQHTPTTHTHNTHTQYPPIHTQFGKRSFPDLNSQITVRDPYFNLVYNITESSIVNGNTLRVCECVCAFVSV